MADIRFHFQEPAAKQVLADTSIVRPLFSIQNTVDWVDVSMLKQ